ncbi:hypothetical protein HRTV-22_gp97 [Halorubrum virus HRTV-22]|nr:hypothetical protein HRTV-19_gp100 [Halorubrum virus HRTV-19]UBF19555.1 hypothetical protein HRTV-23_gp100 [Halorubrum virus HRTV-23]UBF20052.1 hypothetical protein HRTV-22_gp97 [Halorubrum virus HRTV-22]UBF20178.1 hypothetical protein HRTV-26_gp97 [Halorubrum virus HRTV-26]
MSNKVIQASDVDGTVICPTCDEDLGEANLDVADGRGVTQIAGGCGNVWVNVIVTCDECGEEFEVGGQVGVTATPDDL